MSTPSWSTQLVEELGAHPYLFLALFLLGWQLLSSKFVTMKKIPRVPSHIVSSGLFSKQRAAIRNVFEQNNIVKLGYEKYGEEGLFQLPTTDGMVTVLCDGNLIDELKSMSKEKLSFTLNIQKITGKYTLADSIVLYNWHTPIISSYLPRVLPKLVGSLQEEISDAVRKNIIIPEDNEWTPVRPWKAISQISAQAANMFFVGPIQCRDQVYLDAAAGFANTLLPLSCSMRVLPDFIAGFVAPIIRYFTLGKYERINRRQLSPIVNERRERMLEASESKTEWKDKPSDLLQKFLDAKPADVSYEDVMDRMLGVNLAAVNTVGTTFLHALHCLAAYRSYQEPIRKEIQSALDLHKEWTKAAIQDMRLLDSFLKESARMRGAPGLAMGRVVTKPWTMSNGITLPKGSQVYVAGQVNRDAKVYEKPDEFDGYRFVKMRDEEEQDETKGTRHQFVASNRNFVSFGHGIHACPGRFLAAIEMKIMFATLLLEYDLRMEVDGRVPDGTLFEGSNIPDMQAPVLFKRRKV